MEKEETKDVHSEVEYRHYHPGMFRIIVGIILVLVGASALVGPSLIKFFVALVFILLGLRIMTGRHHHRHFHNWSASQRVSSDEDSLNETLIWSGLNKTIRSSKFKGGKVVMIFSGGEIDISQVVALEKTVKLEFVSVFGGGRLIIPKNWKVNLKATAIFGGYNNKTEAGNGDTVLEIEGTAIFGGIEIIN